MTRVQLIGAGSVGLRVAHALARLGVEASQGDTFEIKSRGLPDRCCLLESRIESGALPYGPLPKGRKGKLRRW